MNGHQKSGNFVRFLFDASLRGKSWMFYGFSHIKGRCSLKDPWPWFEWFNFGLWMPFIFNRPSPVVWFILPKTNNSPTENGWLEAECAFLGVFRPIFRGENDSFREGSWKKQVDHQQNNLIFKVFLCPLQFLRNRHWAQSIRGMQPRW